MSYIGDKQRGEVIRLWLTLDSAPTGTPTITITRGQGTALDTPISGVNMTQGADTLEWYYDYTTEAAAQASSYVVKYTAVIDGVTRYAYDNYDVTINDADTIKTETASIQTDTTAIVEDTGTTLPTTLTTIEGKIDTIDTNVDTIKDTDLPAVKAETASIQVETTSIESKLDVVDTNVDAIKARTDVIATAAEDNSAHTSGSWAASGAGAGARAIVFNIKDGSANNLEGVNVSVHNAANADTPLYGIDQTNTNGNTITINLDDATYKVRLSKAGAITSEVETVVVTASGTKALTVVAVSLGVPSNTALCRLWFKPIGLGNATQTGKTIYIATEDKLTIVDGAMIENTELEFTYDSGTATYYFDAIKGAAVTITNGGFGFNHNITVPSTDDADLDDPTLIKV